MRESPESTRVARNEVAAGNHDLSGRADQAASSIKDHPGRLAGVVGTFKPA